MKGISMKYFTLNIILIFLSFFLYASENSENKHTGFSKPLIQDATQIDINQLSGWLSNRGSFFHNPLTGNAGLEYPSGSDKYAVYSSGLWLGGKVNGEVRVAISDYTYEYNPGTMNSDGTWNNPEDSRFKTYKITRDDYIAYTDNDPDTNPNSDWQNWPFSDGAPSQKFVDANGITHSIPLLLGDQTVWTVYNDADPAVHVNMGSAPLGIEVQQLAWAFTGLTPADPDANTIFIKFTIINKGSNNIDSCYASLWSDTDLGDSGDDFVGCDTTLNLAFCYNSADFDGIYGTSPPATGFTLAQGPVVYSAGDIADYNFTKLQDYKNLKMSSFVYYNSARSNNGTPHTPQDVYNYQRALWIDGTPITFGGTGTSGTERAYFMYPSDPENPESPVWLDQAPADRRFMQNTGPFTMAPGDTQEIVIAAMAAQGSTNLNSVTKLKQFAANAKSGLLRSQPITLPPTPKVTYTELDSEIILEWDDYAEQFDFKYLAIPNEDELGNPLQQNYLFEGYIIDQYYNNTFQDPVVYTVLDIAKNGIKEIFDHVINTENDSELEYKSIVKGTDAGVRRFIRITGDSLSGSEESQLINGHSYFFGIQSYAFTPDAPDGKKVIFSPEKRIEAVPAAPPAGTRYSASYGDTISVTKSGLSDGHLLVTVVNPKLLTGLDYVVSFKPDSLAPNKYVWDLTRSDGRVLLSDQNYQAADDRFTVIDGLLIRVIGSSPGIKAVVQVANAGGPLIEADWDEAGAEFGGNNVWHSPSAPSDVNQFYISAGGGQGILDSMIRSLSNSESHDYEVRFSDSESSLYGAWYSDDSYEYIPITAWDIGIGTYEDPSDDVRILTGGGVVLGGFASFTEMDPFFGYPASDWLYLRVPTGPAGTYSAYESDFTSGTLSYAWWDESKEVLAQILFCDYEGGNVLPESGTIVRWITNKINSDMVEFSFSAPVPVSQSQLDQKNDLAKINVYPNPYYGWHPGEIFSGGPYVSFTNLPATCTIRLFTLSGELVEKIERQQASSGEERWDLLNKGGEFVASGIYIYHVDIPGVGEKIGKIALMLSE